MELAVKGSVAIEVGIYAGVVTLVIEIYVALVGRRFTVVQVFTAAFHILTLNVWTPQAESILRAI